MKLRHMYYITMGDEHYVVKADLYTWARWFEDNDSRRVGHDFVDDVRISTVCIGVDHRHGNGPPLIFETMIFGGALDGYQWRYSTWDDAETGHAMAVKKVRAAIRSSHETPSG